MADEKQQPGRGIEAWIVVSFVMGIVGVIGFMVVYWWYNAQIQLAGLCVFVAAGAMAIGLGLWARYFMPGGGAVEHRHGLRSPDEARQAFVTDLERGERVLGRRRLIGGLFGAGLAAAVVGLLFPLRSLGPNPGTRLRRTEWRRGKRLVTSDGKPVRPADVASGSATTVFPPDAVGSADSQALLINYGSATFHPRPGRTGWNVANCVAYSKVCTHAGCPVGLYESESHHLMCPCHQSLFDATDGAKPIFGPASRSLPQLPLDVDAEGYFVANGDFSGLVGPLPWIR